jgi:hypothetical protein
VAAAVGSAFVARREEGDSIFERKKKEDPFWKPTGSSSSSLNLDGKQFNEDPTAARKGSYREKKDSRTCSIKILRL